MSATTLELHPAIQHYLTALETCLRKTPGMSPEDGLADAHEFLQSEWEAVQQKNPPLAGDLYEHFVSTFGTPEEVAAEYAAACELSLDGPASEGAGRCRIAPALMRTRRLRAAIIGVGLVAMLCAAALGFALWNKAGSANVPLEMGPIWAGHVVSFKMGDPPASRSIDPLAALGPPDCSDGTRQPETYVALGCHGQLVLEFTGAWLYDGEGPDLKIMEIGPLAEAVEVAVSSDGEHWLSIGSAKGAEATLDLAGQVQPGDRFRYVRLVDLGTASKVKNQWPGADIDAVAALHATSQ